MKRIKPVTGELGRCIVKQTIIYDDEESSDGVIVSTVAIPSGGVGYETMVFDLAEYTRGVLNEMYVSRTPSDGDAARVDHTRIVKQWADDGQPRNKPRNKPRNNLLVQLWKEIPYAHRPEQIG